MIKWVIDEEYLNELVIRGLNQGHTMEEVHQVLDKYLIIKKGGKQNVKGC